MKRLYIAGPMTGLPELNFPAFHEAAARLRAAGYAVANPAEVRLPEGARWADFMRVDLVLMLGCDGVALLPGWQASQGGALEQMVAHKLELELGTVDEFTARAAA